MSDNLHAMAGAYALDALDPVEYEAYVAHLQRCPDCREEVASLRAVTTRLAASETRRPPAGLRDAVLDEARRTAQAAPDARPSGMIQRILDPARHRWPAVVAAAVVAVLAVVGGSAVYREREAALSAAAMQSKAMRITSAPDAVSMGVDLGATHLVYSSEMQAAALMGEHVPMPEGRGDVYQVWMMHGDGSADPGPTFLPNDGELMVIVEGDLSTMTELAVSVEPRGGSSAPSDQIVVHVSL